MSRMKHIYTVTDAYAVCDAYRKIAFRETKEERGYKKWH